MSFPPHPPPPPPRPPSQPQYPAPPGSAPRLPAPSQGNISLTNGMSNLQVSAPGNVRQPPPPPNQQWGHRAPPAPAPAPAMQHQFPPPPPTPNQSYAPAPAPFPVPTPPQTPQRPMPPPTPPNMQQHQQQQQRPPPPPSPYAGTGAPQYPTRQLQQAPPTPQQSYPPVLPPSQQQGYPTLMADRPPPPPSPYANNANQNWGYRPPPTLPGPMAPAPYPNSGVPPPPPQPNYTNTGFNSLGQATGRPWPPPPGPPPPKPVHHPSHNVHHPSHNIQQQQAQQMQQHQPQPRIDPSQIPRPPLFIRPNDNGPLPIFSPKVASSQGRVAPPPPADSRYLVNDDGNASPQLIRSNLYTIPCDRNTWTKLGEVDMGLLCSPMALPSQEYLPTLGPQPDDEDNHTRAAAPLDAQRIPMVPGVRGTGGKLAPPPRCRNCLAYVNPYWGMDTNTCNFCGTRNATSKDFDVISLQRGTIDYAVDGPYMTRKSGPVQPIFIYALDLTCAHVEHYVELLEQVGIELGRHFQQQPAQQALRQQRQDQQQEGNREHLDPASLLLRQQRPRIGICFVASFGIVVLKRNGPQGVPLSMIMPDVTTDPFCHVPLTEWTFDVSTVEGVDQWTQHIQEDLLEGDLLKNLRKEAGKKNAHGLDGFELSCGGAAMAFCADALAESGGRATWISSRRPNFGAGYIRRRGSSTQQRRPPSMEQATPIQNLEKPGNKEDEVAGDFYRKLQEKCAQGRVVLDIIIHSIPQHVAHQQLELATQGEICRATCGKLTWIAAPGAGWQEPLAEELRRPLLCFQGWDAVFKVRCSSGIQVQSFVSHPGTTMDGGGLSASPELELSCVTPQTNVVVLIEHKIGGLPKEQPFAFVQSALLYSTLSGQRRVRVSTLALRPSANIPDIFLSFDFTAVTTLFLRRAVLKLRERKTEDLNTLHRQARDDILTQIVKLLVSYRQHTNAINSPRGQLILPEKLQLLPLFAMCLLKSPMLRPSMGRRAGNAVVISPTNDERSYFAFQAMMVGPAAAFLLVHPNVFEVGKLGKGVGEWRTPQGAESALSELTKASYHSCIHLPQTVNASMTCLQDDGIYLVDNGLTIYLFFGKDVPEETKKALYHLPISLSLSAASHTLTDYGRLVRRIVWQLRSFCSVSSDGSRSEKRPTFPPVIPVLQGFQGHLLFEQDLMNSMVDDPNAGEKDYTEYLVKLHRLIREKMESK